MSGFGPTGHQVSLELLGRRARWHRRARRVRREAGLCMMRGAATAAGGVAVTYCAVWLGNR